MSACCLILSAVRRFNCCKSPGDQHTNLWYTCAFLGSLPYLMRTVSIFVSLHSRRLEVVGTRKNGHAPTTSKRLLRRPDFCLSWWFWGSSPAVSSQLRCVWIWMRVLRCQCECVSICKYIMPNKREFVSGSSHQGHEQLVTFHGQDNVLLWVFQRFYVLRVCRTCF